MIYYINFFSNGLVSKLNAGHDVAITLKSSPAVGGTLDSDQISSYNTVRIKKVDTLVKPSQIIIS